MTLKEFNLKYLYKQDKHESWKLCEIIDGLYRGDCEDYCLSLRKLMPEKFYRYKLYFCKLPDGTGHCILGDGKKFIDCNYQKWVSKKKFLEDGYTDIKKFWPIDVWYRKLSTKLFGRVLFIGR